MKDTLTNANFPRTSDNRVYHLGLRPGEVANRIVTVGSPSRANTIASFLDAKPKPFVLSSERGFLTITGLYKGTPVSIVSIGMGSPNMDFFVREIRETVNGDLSIIRLGSCGALADVPVGTVVVPSACVQVSRNVDFNFVHPETCDEPAYNISKLVSADEQLTAALVKSLNDSKSAEETVPVLSDTVNASADSFYSSQGRQTSFPDHNADLIEHLQSEVVNLVTLEMETFHLYHLAACWTGRLASTKPNAAAPLTTGPVEPVASGPEPDIAKDKPMVDTSAPSVIRASAAQMVFASRTSQDFITPEHVDRLENWTGQATLEALKAVDIPADRLHENRGSVWELV